MEQSLDVGSRYLAAKSDIRPQMAVAKCAGTVPLIRTKTARVSVFLQLPAQ